MKKLGTTFITRITSQRDMDEFVESLEISSDTVILKPNWVDAEIGSHNEAKSLDMFLTALNRHVIIVESYTFWRTEKMFVDREDYFSSSEAFIDSGKTHWDHFKKQDQWFLKHEGFDQLIKKHNAEYVNITNEVWDNNTVDQTIIKEIVENKFPPVVSQELYSRIPRKLFELRGSDFISFSKAKLDIEYGGSLSIKNVFGLIPDPHRRLYHRTTQPDGPEDRLANSIVDINKIYQSLFHPVFVIDGIENTGIMDWDINQMKILNKNWGVMIGGENGLEVDQIGIKLMGSDFKGVMADMINQYEATFGSFSKSTLTESISEFCLNSN